MIMVKNMTTNDFINYMILTIFICVFHVHIFINKMEKLPGGWGIMFDDVLAGVYANIILQAVLWFKLF